MPAKIDLKPEQTIVFTGDSITDADRNHPHYGPFGNGYVHFVANMLFAKYPELNLNIINTGLGGSTIGDLKRRWRQACLDHKPDVLSVLIGINDLWRQNVSKELPEPVHLEEYELTYRQLLSAAKQQHSCRLVLMQPFMFCDNPANQMFQHLQSYITIVNKLAVEFDAVLVPLQSAVNEQIGQVTSEKWSVDSVHPYVWAHAWIAMRWLEAVCL